MAQMAECLLSEKLHSIFCSVVKELQIYTLTCKEYYECLVKHGVFFKKHSACMFLIYFYLHLKTVKGSRVQ